MEEECKKNKFLLIVTCGLKPSRNSFTNFLNKSDVKVIKKSFHRHIGIYCIIIHQNLLIAQ